MVMTGQENMDKKMGNAGELTLLAFVTDELSESVLKKVPFRDLGIHHNVQIGNTHAAYNFLKKNDSPALLIVDLSESTLPITEIERISEVCEPSVRVIAIGENNDVSVFRQLLTLGVSDYLVKPLNANLLVRRIRELLNEGEESATNTGFAYSGHTIGFVGAAGGVGCSTFALNCGLALAEHHNKHVGVVDMDLVHGTIAHMMDCPVSKGLVDILKDPKRVDPILLDKMITEAGNRFDIMSSEETIMSQSSHCAPGMKILMGLMAQRYNYTVVDCSASASASMRELVFKYADTIVIVCDLTFTSVRSTARLLRYFKDTANLQQKIIVLANKIEQYAAGEIPVVDYEEAIDHPVTFCAHFDSKAPLEALNNGESILFNGGSLADDIDNFTAYIMGKPLIKKSKSKSNFFGLLKRSV